MILSTEFLLYLKCWITLKEDDVADVTDCYFLCAGCATLKVIAIFWGMQLKMQVCLILQSVTEMDRVKTVLK